VRLWVNGQLLIDRFLRQAATEYSASLDLVGGRKYDIRMDYFENTAIATAQLLWSGPAIGKAAIPQNRLYTGDASGADTTPPSSVLFFDINRISKTEIDLAWESASDNVAVTGYEIRVNDGTPIVLGFDTFDYTLRNLSPNTTYKIAINAFDAAGNRGPALTRNITTVPDQPGRGLQGAYFDNMDFTAPVFTRTDPTINFNWGSGSPDPRIAPDTFSIRWTGQIIAPTTGIYTFYTTTDDGVRLTIDGTRYIDKLTPQSGIEYSAQAYLIEGHRYDIVLEYFERFGGAMAKLQWAGPGISKQVVPQSQLFS